MEKVRVKILENGKGLDLPKYETAGAVAMDLYAAIEDDVVLEPSKVIYDYDDTGAYLGVLQAAKPVIIPTGIAVSIPDGYEMQVRSRSGLAFKKNLTVANSPGTIDCVPKGTKIKTVDGEINVEDLFEEEKKKVILSYNEETLEIEEDIVSDMFIVDVDEMIKITMEDGEALSIPFSKEVYTKRGWVAASQLTTEDVILKL